MERVCCPHVLARIQSHATIWSRRRDFSFSSGGAREPGGVSPVIEDVIVVDGVVHAYDFRPAMSGAIPGRTHQLGHVGLSSRLREHEDYILTVDEFEREFTPEELVSCVFRESQVDFAAYHHLNGVGTRRPLGSTQS